MTDYLTNLIRLHLASDMARMEMDIIGGSAFTSATPSETSEDLTEQSLIDAINRVGAPISHRGPAYLRITFDSYALKDTDERLFPVSKNRSRRIHKKLVKRHGGEFRRVPAIWNVNGQIVAHPSFRSQLEAKTKETNRVQVHPYDENPILRPTWL